MHLSVDGSAFQTRNAKATADMTKLLPVFLALIPFAALVSACVVTG